VSEQDAWSAERSGREEAGTGSGLDFLTRPLVLFSLLALLLLGMQWMAATTIMSARKASAVEFAQVSTRELADTYEAQLIRSLRDISQTMSLLEYVIESGDAATQLQGLSDRGMLPPALFFTISVLDAAGEVIASTRPLEAMQAVLTDLVPDPADEQSLQIAPARHDALTGQWWLDFSRPLLTEGDFAVSSLVVSVDAEFFVSGYDESRIGRQGVLGIVGQDGVVRVERGGELISYGNRIPLQALLQEMGDDTDRVAVLEYPHDGLQRYTSARQIFGFPLVMVLGLAVDEQHAVATAVNRRTFWQNAGLSAILLTFLALLARLSLQLQRSREAVLAQQQAHARVAQYQAFHDGLTGLPNRSLFSNLLQQSLAEARRHNQGLAVMFLDLDRFKLINDTLGHDAGDALLIEVGSRLGKLLRESDVVARLGGDEFIVLLREVAGRAQIAAVADKLLEVVSQPYQLGEACREITVSIGISCYPQHGEDEQTLIKHADTAMYHVKQGGRAGYRFYAEEMEAGGAQD